MKKSLTLIVTLNSVLYIVAIISILGIAASLVYMAISSTIADNRRAAWDLFKDQCLQQTMYSDGNGHYWYEYDNVCTK